MPGLLASIFRHPVKGLSPELLERVALEPDGALPNDRRYAVEVGHSGFNPAAPAHVSKMKFVVLARFPELARLRTRLHEASGVFRVEDAYGFGVDVPLDREEGRAALSQFLEAYLSSSVESQMRVLEAPRGHMFSDHPAGRVSVVNLASVRLLEQAVGRPVDPLRFRANLFVDGLAPFAEDDWTIGSTLRIGELEFRVISPIVRCVATHVDPSTGEIDIDLVDQLRRVFDRTTMGTYLAVTRGGLLKVGDEMHAS
ncbi:MAG: MOSC domain-containing protein [Alphaproteobacteria bacterium]|nr:MOSC domain-containing protein [Alphaproteobacteria bacterium]